MTPYVALMLGLTEKRKKNQTRDQPRIPDKQNLPCVSILAREKIIVIVYEMRPIRAWGSLSPDDDDFQYSENLRASGAKHT